MKKTLLITIDFWPKVGGIANYYFNLVKNLSDVTVLTTKDRHACDSTLDFKVIRRRLLTRLPLKPKWYSMFYHILKAAKKDKIEMLWVGEVLPTGTVVYYLSKFLKLPYIVSCHGMDLLQAKKVARRKKMAGKVLRNAKYVSVNSSYTAKLIKSFGVGEDKLRVIHPGINSKVESSPLELPYKYKLRGKKILLSLGRLVERKGFDKVIESLPKVWQRIDDLVYVLIGTGADEKRIKKMIAGEKRIIFINQKISDKEKWTWLKNCHAFIMPARTSGEDAEGFGIVFLEANIYGLPVIAGRAGGVVDAVEDGESGLLVDPNSSKEISSAIIKLFTDDKLRKKMGQDGRLRALTCFSWAVIAKKFEQLLK